MKHVVAKDICDRRGFLSCTQYVHPDGTRGAQKFFDIKGAPKVEITHMNIEGVRKRTMYKLLDYKGKNRYYRITRQKNKHKATIKLVKISLRKLITK